MQHLSIYQSHLFNYFCILKRYKAFDFLRNCDATIDSKLSSEVHFLPPPFTRGLLERARGYNRGLSKLRQSFAAGRVFCDENAVIFTTARVLRISRIRKAMLDDGRSMLHQVTTFSRGRRKPHCNFTLAIDIFFLNRYLANLRKCTISNDDRVLPIHLQGRASPPRAFARVLAQAEAYGGRIELPHSLINSVQGVLATLSSGIRCLRREEYVRLSSPRPHEANLPANPS